MAAQGWAQLGLPPVPGTQAAKSVRQLCSGAPCGVRWTAAWRRTAGEGVAGATTEAHATRPSLWEAGIVSAAPRSLRAG